MKKINIDQFKITEKIDLSHLPTSIDLEAGEGKIQKHLEKTRESLGKWQNKLYAHGKYAVLICIQGMDTSGKDSLIREIFKDFNSRGVEVSSFKTPTPLELKHDFLWRHYIALPARGKFGVFNRTHYENVLVTRVHPEYVLKENLPHINKVSDITPEFWEKRFREIRHFEKTLAENGTIIFKFFMNISKEEQRHRLLRRLNKPDKNWKFSPDDLQERNLWNKYRDCYQDAINNTSEEWAPWYAIPSDDKVTSRYLVTKILHEDLQKKYPDVKEPELAPEIKKHLDEYKEELRKEK